MTKKTLLFILILFAYVFSTAQTSDKQPLKLRVGTYNIGHFNQGRLGGYKGEYPDHELQRWQKWIGEQSFDILSLNEWNTYFDKDSTIIAKEALLAPLYNNLYFGDANTWIYNGLATNYTLENIRQIVWYAGYYAIIGDLKIGNKTITLISTHIPWQKEAHDTAIKDLITEMEQYEYIICMGDMNASDQTQLGFIEAGFNIANGGFQGFFKTLPHSKSTGNIDNIITSKNIKIMNVSAPNTGLTEDDHYPIIADVVITW